MSGARARAMAIAVATAAVWLAAAPGGLRAQDADTPPRTESGAPDLNGFWQALNSAHWNLEPHEAAPGPILQLGAAYAVPPGQGVVQDGAIPYTDAARARRSTYAEAALREDGEVKCYLPGVPRMMYMPYPVQIVQSSREIVMMSEFASAVRTIYMDSTDPPPADTWMGWSTGRWDGDTLVVDTRGFMSGTIGALDPLGAIHVRFLDRAGNYHTDGLHVVERIRRIGPDHLSYVATLEDPNVFTRPWTISMPLYRRVEPNMALGEFKCEDFVGDLIYGPYAKDPIVVR